MPEGGTRERLRLWLERAGDGFRLRNAATEELVRAEDPRIRVIKVAGVSYRLEALRDDAFAPGKKLALRPEPDNQHDPHAMWKDTTTRSPGRTICTSAPIASTTPTASCPRTAPGSIGALPWRK